MTYIKNSSESLGIISKSYFFEHTRYKFKDFSDIEYAYPGQNSISKKWYYKVQLISIGDIFVSSIVKECQEKQVLNYIRIDYDDLRYHPIKDTKPIEWAYSAQRIKDALNICKIFGFSDIKFYCKFDEPAPLYIEFLASATEKIGIVIAPIIDNYLTR